MISAILVDVVVFSINHNIAITLRYRIDKSNFLDIYSEFLYKIEDNCTLSDAHFQLIRIFILDSLLNSYSFAERFKKFNNLFYSIHIKLRLSMNFKQIIREKRNGDIPQIVPSRFLTH